MTEQFTAHYRLPIPQFNSVPWHQQWENSLRAVDEALYRATITDAPMWANDTQYFIGSMTVDPQQGTLWTSTVEHLSPSAPMTFAQYRAANPANWQGISVLPEFRGEWVSGKTYYNNDFVLSGSKYAVCKVSHIAGATFAADEAAGKWETLVDVGQSFVGINDIATAAVPAANTINLGATTATRMIFTGVAPGGTISNFGNTPNTFKIIQMGSNGNTIVHNAVSLILPDGNNIVAQANDIFYFVSNTAGNWMLWGMMRKLSATDFNDIKQPATQTYQGVVELATDAEAAAKVDNTRVITPANLAALIATTIAKGLVELATDAEANAHADATRVLTPSNLAAMGATTVLTGLVELATAAEALALTDATRAITPDTLGAMVASVTQRGIVELATVAETQTGTDATRAVTPASLAGLLATTILPGLLRIATNAEAIALTEPNAAITPATLGNVQSTTTQRGIIEMADNAEIAALAVANRAISPDTLGTLAATTTQRGISRFATAVEAAAMTSTSISISAKNLDEASATRAQVEGELGSNLIKNTEIRYAPGVVKCAGTVTAAGAILYGYNLAGTVDGGTGIMTFTIDNDLTNTSYAAQGSAIFSGGADMAVTSDVPAVGAFALRSYNTAGALTEPTRFCGIALGVRA